MTTSVTLNPSVTNVTVSNTDTISVDLTTDSTTVELTNGVILPQSLGTTASPSFRKLNISTFSGGINFTSSFTDYSGQIKFQDNKSTALQFNSIANGNLVAYQTFDSTDGAENVKFHKDVNVTGTVTAGDTTINGSFTVNNILFTNTDLSATEFEAAQGKRIVRQSGTVTKTFALFQPAAANVGQTWTILNSSSGNITLDADSQYFHILDGVTLAGKQADWAIKRGGVVDIICIGSLANGGSPSFPNFVIYGSGIIEL